MNTDYWRHFFEGKVVGDYEVGEFLGAGGFALVFAAQQQATGQTVALKLLPPTAGHDQSEEFHNEGSLLKILDQSSSVVRIYESREIPYAVPSADGSDIPVRIAFHALELGFGCLEELVLNRASLRWSDRLDLWRGVVRGVHQMHLKSVAHRDLKSGNCLVFMRPKNIVESKVADLGRSRNWAGPRLHGPAMYSHGLGDFRFAPPELLLGLGVDSADCHTRADLYGLGSVLFELATGQGITSTALGNVHAVMHNFGALQASGRAATPDAFLDDYERAYNLFSVSVPPSIRDKAVPLLRQLCSPLPSARTPKTSNKKNDRALKPGLDWLIRRVDIVRKSLVEVEVPELSKAGAS